jgi:Transposase DDE domain
MSIADSNKSIKDPITVDYQMTCVFCQADDFFKSNPKLTQWRNSNNDQPEFTDAEVITIALMQPIFGVSNLKRAYLLTKSFFSKAFPKLPSYAQFLARLHALAPFIGMLTMNIALKTKGEGNVYLMDSKPIPLCKAIRHVRVRLLRDEGAYFGKNKAGWYFGFKLHLLAHSDGTILGAFLTPGNWDDRDVAAALVESLSAQSVLIADLGYRDSKVLEPLLAEQYGVLLVTRSHAPERLRPLISCVRERIETVFSCFWNRFMDLVFSRSFTGLWSAIRMKMLHYTLCKAGILPPLNP